MRDISAKVNTLRTAIASAVLQMSPASVAAVRDNTGPKKDICATARAAAFLAAKHTASVIPHCHPVPVESALVDFIFSENEIRIEVTVKAVYKTGVEMEALHAASVAALVVYDMLKPLDDVVTITGIKLEEKKGGKSDFADVFDRPLTAAIIVCSDAVSAGKKTDTGGEAIRKKLLALGFEAVETALVPDDAKLIREKVIGFCDRGLDLVMTTGGTGLGPRDTTPEALADLIERNIPGIMEAARAYGQERTPFAMMSRGISGLRGKSLILTLPGSTRGAAETMDALFPSVMHIFKVLDLGFRHGL